MCGRRGATRATAETRDDNDADGNDGRRLVFLCCFFLYESGDYIVPFLLVVNFSVGDNMIILYAIYEDRIYIHF